ncbi:phosphodiesterase [Rhodococcus sp. NPDC003322]
MNEIDAVLRVPSTFASALRRVPLFHSSGVATQGHAELGSHWWPVQGRIPVTARLSRALGLPNALPDVLGLSVRLHLAAGPWDLLLVSAQPTTRVVPLPARGWSSARYSSLTAFRTTENDALTWALAKPEAGQPRTGSLRALSRGDQLFFTLSLATARSDPTPAGRLSLDPPTTCEDTEQADFDPVLHRPDGVQMWPQWVAAARQAAHGGSRTGRHAAPA